MKRFFSLVALLAVFVVSAPYAEAKKFGGGKSFGKSHKTAPAQKQQQQNTDTLKQKDTKQSSSKKGLMGGLLGGLLAGGLLAAFFGGAFDGIQFMDILIMGLIAFALFKLFRYMMASKAANMNRQQPAYAGSNREQTQQNHSERQAANSGFGGAAQSDVPHNYPKGFNVKAFVDGSREHYRAIQGAWNHNQLEKIQEYVSPSLFADLKEERAKLGGEQHTEVMYVDAEVVRADCTPQLAQLSLQFSGRYRDAAEKVEEEITDIWHLERDLTKPNSPWLIVGIQA